VLQVRQQVNAPGKLPAIAILERAELEAAQRIRTFGQLVALNGLADIPQVVQALGPIATSSSTRVKPRRASPAGRLRNRPSATPKGRMTRSRVFNRTSAGGKPP
jgi:hypothetical protein